MTTVAIKENRSIEKIFDRHGERNPVCSGLDSFLSPEEDADLENRKNVATHIIKNQGLHLKQLLKEECLQIMYSI